VYPRRTTTPPSFGGFGGLTGPIPRDLLVLFGVLFATFSLSFFGTTKRLIELLLLSPDVWRGYVWQIVTYPFVGIGGLFFLLTLIFLYMFARDVFYGLGRRHFWRLVLAAAIGSALIALLVDALMRLAGWPAGNSFALMQGQSFFWALFIAAYATANRGATIYLIIFPIEARWFLALEALMIFIGFLFTKDLPGLFGMYTALGIGVGYIRSGGKGIRLRELRLRMERRWIQWKLDRGKRKFRVIPGDRDRGGNGEVRKGPWVH
jgi:membrane associated rhomboid family serine protease